MTREAALRRVIFHADDFGMNPVVNAGIVQAFESGLLTSTSVLTNSPHAGSALEAWKRLSALNAGSALPSAATRRQLGDVGAPFDLGIHLNLSQGRPLTGEKFPHMLLDSAGCFPGIFGIFRRLLNSGSKYLAPIEAELAQQTQFLLDHGLQPTHLNGHQYVEMIPGVVNLIPGIFARYRIPVARVAIERRLFRSTVLKGLQLHLWALGSLKQFFAGRFQKLLDSHKLPYPDGFFGTVHAGRLDLSLLRIYLAHSERYRNLEMCMHPATEPVTPRAQDLADGWADPLERQRPGELRLLTSPELPELLSASGVQLGRLNSLAVAR